MPDLAEPYMHQVVDEPSRDGHSRVRFLPLLFAGLLAIGIWIFNGGQQAAPPATTGLLTAPAHGTTPSAAGPTTAISSTDDGPAIEDGPVRPSVENATALGSRDLAPSGLTPVALYGSARQLIADSDETLWWRADWGLGRFDPASREAPAFFTAEDDLFFGSITTISPAVEGGVWAAGDDSTLRRFDGEGFVEVIATPQVLCLVSESPQLGVWGIGCGWDEHPVRDIRGDLVSFGWLYRWDGDVWKTEPVGRPHPGADELIVDSGGQVWVANRIVGKAVNTGGLSVYDGSKWTSFTTEDGLPSDIISRIAGALPGELWVRAYLDASVFEGTRWRSPSGDTALDEQQWRGLASIVAVEDDRVALIRWNGLRLVQVAGSERTEWPVRAESVSNLTTAAGHAWIAADETLYRIEGTEMQPVAAVTPATAAESPAPPELAGLRMVGISADEALFIDPYSYWQPTTKRSQWRCTADGECVQPPDVPVLIDVVAGRDGHFYGLGGDVLSSPADDSPVHLLRLESDTWRPVTQVSTWGAIYDSWWGGGTIAAALEGVVWLHDCGVHQVYEHGILPLFAFDPFGPRGFVFCPETIAVDATGVLWGADGGEVRLLAGGRWVPVQSPEPSPMQGVPRVTEIAEGTDRRLWVVVSSYEGSEDPTGVHSFDGEAWLRHLPAAANSLGYVAGHSPSRILAALPEGRMALVTETGLHLTGSGGLARVLSGVFTSVSSASDGSLWFAGPSGVYVWPGEYLEAFRPSAFLADLGDGG